jgi:hypothetical protein
VEHSAVTQRDVSLPERQSATKAEFIRLYEGKLNEVCLELYEEGTSLEVIREALPRIVARLWRHYEQSCEQRVDEFMALYGEAIWEAARQLSDAGYSAEVIYERVLPKLVPALLQRHERHRKLLQAKPASDLPN